MGIVTLQLETRSDEREIYYPAHERAMAHYSYSSPDRKWILLVEMDRTAAWQRCRLVPLDGIRGGLTGRPCGRMHRCRWLPDWKVDVLLNFR